MKNDYIERFLSRLESNETHIFNFCTDFLFIPIFPFFQLVHILNMEEVIDELTKIDSVFNSLMIRVDGYLSLALDEVNYDEKMMKNMVTHVLNIMRF
ncbi:hypothetical protein NUF46_004283 [Yersinia enterocolitica]|nr:hypothetical protein [Yersinia enterocolitica]